MLRNGFFRDISKKYIKKSDRMLAVRPNILHRLNLSLAGCSSAEPDSVSVQHLQNSIFETIFTTCRKKQPFTLF